MVNGDRDAQAYQAYQRARDAVLRMKQSARVDGGLDPSAYWRGELENIDYLIEASPLIVRKLRHHSFHITGIRPYDYRSKGDGRREYFEARLAALRELGGDALLVPESPALGGFGYDVDGRLFNVDTLKFYEVLIAMERGGVLASIRAAARPVVCEIGPGWAGFAYQFKTLFPAATYVLVDFPELFLFSATYLAAQFPDARLHFVESEADLAADAWRGADFVFVPDTLAHLLAGLPLDLAVNMVSFQEMTEAQVRRYAMLAARAGCPALYSLNRDRSPYNAEIASVSAVLGEYYTLTQVDVLDTDYTSVNKKPPKTRRVPEPGELVYRHLVGTLAAGPHLRPSGDGAQATLGRPPVVLGMTLFNNAAHLPEAIESLLLQRDGNFVLVMMDDASSDATETIARRYAAADPRLHYRRHETRQAMVATWRDVVAFGRDVCPTAQYFAWVSDHDRWHPRWLETLVAELDADATAVVAYPITRRMDSTGAALDKGARLFDTADAPDLRSRWRRFCHDGIGSGDMVYGLMRLEALLAAGVFRRVLRPDRLLMAELTLQGRFRQVPEALWFRRQAETASVDRQRFSLVLPNDEPPGFARPPWLQHVQVLWREYADRTPRPFGLSKAAWIVMLLRYQVTYAWRHFRKTETSHAMVRGVDQVIWAKKITRHHYHHTVYNTLVGGRALWGRCRRGFRRAVYEVLMLTHRLGLRRTRETPRA
jgi:glycosyltransferase involved in cell wall biosynthesis